MRLDHLITLEDLIGMRGNRRNRPTSNVITFGTFDLLHIGHLNILTKAKASGRIWINSPGSPTPWGDPPNATGWWGPEPTLIVGVSSDELNYNKKKKCPILNQDDRMTIIGSLKMVDTVFLEESLELKREYIQRYNAEILVMGDDWKGKFDELKDICDVVYLPRTPSISTTSIIEKIVN